MRILIEDKLIPLSRDLWVFDYSETYGFRLVEYRQEKRQTTRHKWVAEKWDSMDERRYNSALDRPTAIPENVLLWARLEMIKRIKEADVYIGWFNEESKL
ncbi:hypothetical protein P106B_87 [Rhizobium phage vB_RglS_P106B]|uniref:Uncharacterized protein n=1 Tax=Rhizobium phage vB_RglS_P106B TaxID=1458697 RepID=W6E8K0_9CAUD|nr:hypothetical protein P106B_87 [Rhizobium phage vB_RglS_P106B]AHJ10770.1 hypothetical protein P106B_87 [Rhizobium phage vB_RglS_P106B]